MCTESMSSPSNRRAPFPVLADSLYAFITFSAHSISSFDGEKMLFASEIWDGCITCFPAYPRDLYLRVSSLKPSGLSISK